MTYVPLETHAFQTTSASMARDIARSLLSHTAHDWGEGGLAMVSELRSEQRSSPLVLSVTEAALTEDAHVAKISLRDVLARLDDYSWAAQVASDVSEAPSLGVVSLGHETLAVLEAVSLLATEPVQLVAPTRAVARGLGYLRQPILLGPAAHADTLLLPGLAFDPITIWTHRSWAVAAWSATDGKRRVRPVLHPLRSLSPMNRRAFRPPAGIVAIRRPG
ncbi:MAG: hypothetical protein KJN81_10470 [Acidimicrobiia bacterium]|nr:hypothetical protein [Acidimicrobiia bacterium]NNL28838.1 hypothetical protein [Acidimicrobiia bacterium]